jgi:hypothetical protein
MTSEHTDTGPRLSRRGLLGLAGAGAAAVGATGVGWWGQSLFA